MCVCVSIWAYSHVWLGVWSVYSMSLCVWLCTCRSLHVHHHMPQFVIACATHVYMSACGFFVCVEDFAWACVWLHVHQQGCLLSVCIRWAVFFLLNHWWDCNSNSGPPISSTTFCHQLAASQCRLQENQYAALTKHRQQTCPGNEKKKADL